MFYSAGLILLALVILDGLFLWSIGVQHDRYPAKRLVYNTIATCVGGFLIWLGA